MILTFRHRDPRGNQKYDGSINISPSSGAPSSFLNAPIPGSITNNAQFIRLPINCVLIGDQKDKNPNKYVTDLHGLLKKIIFGE